MEAPALILELPLASTCRLFELFGRRDEHGWFCFEPLRLRESRSGDLVVRQIDKAMPMLRALPGCGSPVESEIEVAPGLVLCPVDQDSLESFFQSHATRPDHIGLNISQAVVSESVWADFIAATAVLFPSYRLLIPSVNDVVMVLFEDLVLELVYDRSSPRSSFHICLAVDADRASLEGRFPSPLGGYKVGDEAFFRTLALPSHDNFPCYLDIAFRDGAMQPWRDIVQALGRRVDVGSR